MSFWLRFLDFACMNYSVCFSAMSRIAPSQPLLAQIAPRRLTHIIIPRSSISSPSTTIRASPRRFRSSSIHHTPSRFIIPASIALAIAAVRDPHLSRS